MKNMQTGRSMIEMIAVLMIIGVITVGALAGLSQANDKYKTSKIHNDIQAISSEVVNLFSWQRQYPNSSASGFMKTVCDNDIFPDGCDDNNVPFNPYGGEYSLTTNQSSQTMTVQATLIPTASCEDLVLREWAYKANVNPSGCSSNPCCTGSGTTQTFVVILN